VFYASCAAIHGADFNIAIFEEAARIPKDVLAALSPILGLNDACFVAITTPKDEDNYISVMFEQKNEKAAELFQRIRIETWCSECKENGISAFDCMAMKHETDRLPPWKSSSKNESVAALMPDADQFASDVAGVIRKRVMLMEKQWITDFTEAKRVSARDVQFKEIYSFIDNAGGGSSRMSIVSMCDLPSGKASVIVGITSEPTPNPLTEEAAIKAHFQALRNLPCCKGAVNIVFVERNYGNVTHVVFVDCIDTNFQ